MTDATVVSGFDRDCAMMAQTHRSSFGSGADGAKPGLGDKLMGLDYRNLTDVVRRFMLEEVELDEADGTSYLSKRLHEAGCERWPSILRDAVSTGTDDTLAEALRRDDCLHTHFEHANPKSGGITTQKMPVNAPDLLAQGEFNRFYIRGLCRLAIQSGIPQLVGYRARYSENPRSSSVEADGARFDAQAVLNDLRSAQGEETMLNMPGGPGSGISLKLP